VRTSRRTDRPQRVERSVLPRHPHERVCPHLDRRVTGPQRTLYVPAPVTRAGQNEVIVIELEQMLVDAARFAAGPLLGPEEE
jgi:hypothetical protein